MRRSRAIAVAVVAVLAVASASCRGPESQPSSTGVVTTAFAGTDAAWTQLMIPMTVQAIALLELAAARASGSKLASLATELAPGYRSDLLRLRTALARAGLAETDEHDGHDLPGMITPADLTAVGRAGGPGFDALVVQHLREQMEQSVRLARSEQKSGRDRGCTAIAASIEKTRSTSLNRLNGVIRP